MVGKTISTHTPSEIDFNCLYDRGSHRGFKVSFKWFFFSKSDGGETFSFLLKFGKKSFSENSDGIITDRWHYLYV